MTTSTSDLIANDIAASKEIVAESLTKFFARVEALERVAVAARAECDPSKELRNAIRALDAAS